MYNFKNKNLYSNDILNPNKNQRYYYDFGTGNKVEKDEVKKARDAFLNSATKPLNQKKDDFLEGFNDPYGEKEKKESAPEYSFEKNLRQKTLNMLQNPTTKTSEWKNPFLKGFNFYSDKQKASPYVELHTSPKKKTSNNDEFLEGFNQAQKEENAWKSAFSSAKEGIRKGFDTVKSKGKDIIDGASVFANKIGILDDVTNTFFKEYDDFKKNRKILSPDYRSIDAQDILAGVNYIRNKKLDLSEYEEQGGYINDQNKGGSTSGKIRYGVGDFNSNGCEIIAVNNALVSLGEKKDIRDIAWEFENDGQVLGGLFGTSPYAIGDYFRKRGYKVKTYEGDKRIYNLDIPDADTYIISFWNSDKVTNAIHTVAMDKLDNGKFRIYNEGWEPTKDIDSLNTYLREKTRVPLVLHCIEKGR